MEALAACHGEVAEEEGVVAVELLPVAGDVVGLLASSCPLLLCLSKATTSKVTAHSALPRLLPLSTCQSRCRHCQGHYIMSCTHCSALPQLFLDFLCGHSGSANTSDVPRLMFQSRFGIPSTLKGTRVGGNVW